MILKRQNGVGVIVVIGIIALLMVALVAYFQISKARNKASIDKEVSLVTAPNGCIESRRIYQQGDGIDSVPTWFVTYDCKDGIDSAYAGIKIKAKADGYTVERDKPAVDKSGSLNGGSVCLLRNGYYSYWTLSSNSNVVSDGKRVEPSAHLEIHSKKYFPCT